MTGEITLSGNVLPIGGVKEKVLAAKRAGVRDIILPAENKTNVEEDLTPEQLENLSIHYVKSIHEVLESCAAFVASRRKAGCGRAGKSPHRTARQLTLGIHADRVHKDPVFLF